MIGQMIPPLSEAPLEDYYGGIVETGTIWMGKGRSFSWCSAGSMIIRPTGKEFYSWYIWWSIIGGVRYPKCKIASGRFFHSGSYIET